MQRNFIYKSKTQSNNQIGTADKGQNTRHEISKPEDDPKGSQGPKAKVLKIMEINKAQNICKENIDRISQTSTTCEITVISQYYSTRSH